MVYVYIGLEYDYTIAYYRKHFGMYSVKYDNIYVIFMDFLKKQYSYQIIYNKSFHTAYILILYDCLASGISKKWSTGSFICNELVIYCKLF